MKRRYIILFLLILGAVAPAIAQTSVSSDGSAPHGSAMLEVKSTAKGFLPPRLNTQQRNAVVAPATGLVIYNTDCNDLQLFNGTAWIPSGNFGMLDNPGPISGSTSPSQNATGMVYSVEPVAGATGYAWTVPPGATAVNGQGTNSVTVNFGIAGGQVCVTAYNDCLKSLGSCLQVNVVSFTCGTNLTINHQAGAVAPVTKTVVYGSVGNIPGEPSKCWITSNLGSDHQASSVDDNTEASAGWYWQFNRKQGYKHDGATRTPSTSWINPIIENSDWMAANDPCTIELGSAWRIPTFNEWYNVINAGGWTNWNGPWNSGLKLHAAGLLHTEDGSLFSRGVEGFYWSNQQSIETGGWNLYISGGGYCSMVGNGKAWGFSVRCLKDN